MKVILQLWTHVCGCGGRSANLGFNREESCVYVCDDDNEGI